jgi:Tfp pilus assembly protein PilN
VFINLLPPGLGIKLLIRRRLRGWAIVWGFALVVGVLAVSNDYADLLRVRTEFDHLSNRVQPLEQLHTKISTTKKRLRDLDQEVNRLQAVCVDDRSLAVLKVVGQSIEQIAGKVQVDHLNMVCSGWRTSAGKTKKSGPGPLESTVALRGIATDDLAIADFVAALRRSGVFAQVDLRSTQQFVAGKIVGRQFQIACNFVEGNDG